MYAPIFPTLLYSLLYRRACARKSGPSNNTAVGSRSQLITSLV